MSRLIRDAIEHPAILGAALLLLSIAAMARGDEPSQPRLRQPVALAFDGDGAWLFAANRRSGSLSVIDVAASRVVAEPEVGRGLADLAPLPGGRRLLAVDQAGDRLVLVEVRGPSVRVVDRLDVAADP